MSGLLQSSTVTYQGVPVYFNGRGDLGRTPMLNQTDLLVAHDLPDHGSTKLGLQANVTNLFDQDTVTGIAFAAYRDAMVIPNFGEPRCRGVLPARRHRHGGHPGVAPAGFRTALADSTSRRTPSWARDRFA